MTGRVMRPAGTKRPSMLCKTTLTPASACPPDFHPTARKISRRKGNFQEAIPRRS